TVDITAAKGAAKTKPANQPGIISKTITGIAKSGAEILGYNALITGPNTPKPKVNNPIIITLNIIPLCIDLVFLYVIPRTAKCGIPTAAIPNTIKFENNIVGVVPLPPGKVTISG